MVANKSEYVYGSAAKKLEYIDYKESNNNSRRKVIKKTKASKNIKVQSIFFASILFIAFMVITYRYNMISESNLTLQNLKKDLNTVQSNLASSQMNIDQNTDMNKIEAYAKQQLGMQKPDKNQVVYLDTSASSEVVKENNNNFGENIIATIKQYINNIK